MGVQEVNDFERLIRLTVSSREGARVPLHRRLHYRDASVWLIDGLARMTNIARVLKNASVSSPGL